jgi:glycosyltransferase involved in cell wall biosynthesis
MSRPRLLLVTSRFPFPAIGGAKMRVFNLSRLLQRHFDVVLVSLGAPSAEDIAGFKRETGVGEVHCVPQTRLESLWGAFKALVTGQPLQVGYYRSRALDAKVGELAASTALSIFHLIRTSASWHRQASQPVVLEMCDAISANFEQTARQGAWWSPWRIVSAIEAPRTLAFERAEAARFDLVSIHTHKDAMHVGIPPAKLLVSTQGVSVGGLTFTAPSQRRGRAIALIGKMDFFPNWHGAEWFAKSVLPLLPADIVLKVVGDCTPEIRERLVAIPRVQVTGRVASLGEACADCIAAIAPMHVATGIQNKVLEYFAMGLPAVVSPSVASGLLPSAAGGYQEADAPSEWADALLRVTQDPARADDAAELARDYVFREHSWDQIGADYAARLQSMLNSSASKH